MADKVDLRKDLKALYAGTKDRIVVVEVPPLGFLMVDGAGDPNTAPAYREAVEALYAVAYTLKFAMKEQGRDFAVGVLEGLWWADDPAVFLSGDRALWHWSMMIAVPDFVTPAAVDAAKAKAAGKKDLPGAARLRWGRYDEGVAVQTLYLGPYSGEGPTIAGLHAHIKGLGKRLYGRHHEIYLSDPRRTAPEKLKTIIRQPFW
ncbi:MAG: GyrI-like domain-containing protein [Bauldia sp.]|nr:GyrI-like domain-containing protein [Bauldia sp.]MCW5717929.1 GyrI-like domain-containing protein [Bauldia sp.]